MGTEELCPQFVSVNRIITLIDLAGSTKAFQSKGDIKMAALFQQYYTDCEAVLTARGGTVIKFMGDACLAIFPPDQAQNATEAVLELRSRVAALCERFQVSLEMGANLHMADAVEAEFGAGASRARDILGRGVNQTFLLGRGAGIRISEPVYRGLPSAARSSWRKHKPPAVYHRDDRADKLYAGMGKDPATNAERW